MLSVSWLKNNGFSIWTIGMYEMYIKHPYCHKPILILEHSKQYGITERQSKLFLEIVEILINRFNT